MNGLKEIRGWRHALGLALVLTALYLLSTALVIYAKAWLAPILIERAWQQTLQRGVVGSRPWPWADTWPVGRLSVPSRNVDLLVLEGDSGHSLAFGPGRTLASAPLGTPGLAVIGGHRDTHFAFLRHLQNGTRLELRLPTGEVRAYTVDGLRIADSRREVLHSGLAGEALLLVTCYPFDAIIAGGPLRYVVSARPQAVRLGGAGPLQVRQTTYAL